MSDVARGLVLDDASRPRRTGLHHVTSGGGAIGWRGRASVCSRCPRQDVGIAIHDCLNCPVREPGYRPASILQRRAVDGECRHIPVPESAVEILPCSTACRGCDNPLPEVERLTTRRSRRWISEHGRDPFVRKARADGYRSRAAYKLQEIAEREGLLRRGQRVLDLGAAPGGWSQVAAERVGPRGRVVALDLLPMAALPGVRFVQGNFSSTGVRGKLREAMEGEAADLILSDMAPNLEGVRVADAAMSLELAENVIAVVPEWLASGGALLIKVFESPETRCLRRDLTQRFCSVRVRKPAASRASSSEIYLMAKGFGL